MKIICVFVVLTSFYSFPISGRKLDEDCLDEEIAENRKIKIKLTEKWTEVHFHAPSNDYICDSRCLGIILSSKRSVLPENKWTSGWHRVLVRLNGTYAKLEMDVMGTLWATGYMGSNREAIIECAKCAVNECIAVEPPSSSMAQNSHSSVDVTTPITVKGPSSSTTQNSHSYVEDTTPMPVERPSTSTAQNSRFSVDDTMQMTEPLSSWIPIVIVCCSVVLGLAFIFIVIYFSKKNKIRTYRINGATEEKIYEDIATFHPTQGPSTVPKESDGDGTFDDVPLDDDSFQSTGMEEKEEEEGQNICFENGLYVSYDINPELII